ncbi:MAG: indole-3-glycerol phosphate synthase TrpC [candidate division NC10 bacterium]|nr:indole-3-glycerol phosphate synthase TrpC [candidate division NC10 bacterium]
MSILDTILERTRADLIDRMARLPLVELRARCRDLPPTRDFLGAVRREPEAAARRKGPLRVIAEVKKASPSRGVIRGDFQPASIAADYAAAGAGAISVLTDAPFFQGGLADLAAVRQAVGLPILRKDFHVDPYQLWEARAAGADAVLLIAAALAQEEIQNLLGLAAELGLHALVEVHGRDELGSALACDAKILGINNRDLRTFQVTLQTTFDLLPLVPADRVLISESGVATALDARRLEGAGVDGILVGEGLLRHADVGAALRELVALPGERGTSEKSKPTTDK